MCGTGLLERSEERFADGLATQRAQQSTIVELRRLTQSHHPPPPPPPLATPATGRGGPAAGAGAGSAVDARLLRETRERMVLMKEKARHIRPYP